MSRKRKALVLFALGVALLLPSFTYVAAQTATSGAGLVPCGVTLGTGESEVKIATGCQACHLTQLVQNIINFIVGISITLAILLVAWAGFLYFSSGARPDNINKGKDVLKNTAIGFLVVISAWIIVNTLLYTLLDKKQYPESSWFRIECTTEPRPIDVSIGDILEVALGDIPDSYFTVMPEQGGDGGYYRCPEGTIPNGAGLCSKPNSTTVVSPIPAPGIPSGATGNPGVANFDGSVPPGSCSGIVGCAAFYAQHRIDSSLCSPYVDGGNLACACMVNRILNAAGRAPIDGDSVPQMRKLLDDGAGTRTQTPQPGDLVIWLRGGLEKHVGVCANAGCTMAYSNSSSQALVRLHAINALGYTSWMFYRVR